MRGREVGREDLGGEGRGGVWGEERRDGGELEGRDGGGEVEKQRGNEEVVGVIVRSHEKGRKRGKLWLEGLEQSLKHVLTEGSERG